ncbi:hypothetical protein HYPSUDRAFT_71072 [Hypholoma sublateritium FD-334 SS-4]|uniref:Uncharacterized protein n=1 Tax=Hypholoma sublateritium (strain FD-334 SS-4) TaxID=945553 RepID=A0A0D2P976_HYPSF|nr:hypothetical protein HYPSUDRAFT_71072 [Hypholoma sublateritium FD-334 SS-4]
MPPAPPALPISSKFIGRPGACLLFPSFPVVLLFYLYPSCRHVAATGARHPLPPSATPHLYHPHHLSMSLCPCLLLVCSRQKYFTHWLRESKHV